MEKMQEIFKRNAVACDGIVACSVEDWNFIATTLTGLFDKAERVKELEEFVRMVADGDSAEDSMKGILVHTYIHNAKTLLGQYPHEQ